MEINGEKYMYFRALFCVFSILIISVLGIYFGYLPRYEVKEVPAPTVVVIKVQIDPEGSIQEQLAYHRAEILKYEKAAAEEEVKANQYLSLHQMNDVRQANSRKSQYLKKIEEHVEAIEGLQRES